MSSHVPVNNVDTKSVIEHVSMVAKDQLCLKLFVTAKFIISCACYCAALSLLH